MQECDRLPQLLPAFPEHDLVEARGRGKLHGLVILYRAAKWRVKATRTVYLDQEDLTPVRQPEEDDRGASRKRRGGSMQTKNVGLIVGLERADGGGEGVVVTTTHL